MNDISTWEMGICPECTTMQEMQLCPVCGHCQHHCRDLEGCPLRQPAPATSAGPRKGQQMGANEPPRR